MTLYPTFNADDLWNKITRHVDVMLHFNNITLDTLTSVSADSSIIVASTRVPACYGDAPQEAVVFVRNGCVYFTLEHGMPDTLPKDLRALLNLSDRPGTNLFASYRTVLSVVATILGRMERELLDLDVLRCELDRVPMDALVAEIEKVPYTGLSDVTEVVASTVPVYVRTAVLEKGVAA